MVYVRALTYTDLHVIKRAGKWSFFFCGLTLTETNDHLYSFDQGPRVLSQFQQQVRQVHETDLQLAQVSTDQVSSLSTLKSY